MAQIFFSFTEADYPVVSHLASYLAHEGYSSWNYKDNGVPGVNYLEQIEEELAAAKVVIVIVSRQTLSSDQVYHELHTAHERSIPYLPVLVGLSHKDLQVTGKKLEMYVRRNTSIQIGPNVQTIFESIKAGLVRFGVVADHAVSSEPYTFPQHEQLASAPSSQKFELRPSRKSEKKSASHIWSGVIGAVALSGLVFLLTQSSGEKPQSATLPLDTSRHAATDTSIARTTPDSKVPEKRDPSKQSTSAMAAPAKSATCASGFLIVADDPDDPTGMMRKTLKSELNTESSAERFAQSEFSNVYAKYNVRYVVMADVQIDTKRALNKHTIVVNVRVLDSVNGAERFKNSYTQEKTTPALDAFRANALKDIAKQASLSILSIT